MAQSRPLRMWDAQTDAAGDPAERVDVDAELIEQDGATVLELRPSMDYLSDPEREYPVTVDPDVAVLDRAGDTYYFSGQPTLPHEGLDYRLVVGSPNGTTRYRSLMTFNYKRLLGYTVRSANLEATQYWNGTTTCAPKLTNLFPIDGNDGPNLTWSNQPDYNNEMRWRGSKSSNAGGTGCSPSVGTETWDVSSMVAGWAGGQFDYESPENRQGIMIAAGSELDTTFEKRFCSLNYDTTRPTCDTPELTPRLTVTYEPELGLQSWYSTTDHTFNDRSSLSVNNRNGNAVVSSADGSVNGVGLDFNIDRTYNSQASDTGTTLGKGWSLGVGPDVWMEKRSPYRYDFHGPSGTVLGSFIQKNGSTTEFEAPLGGVGAELKRDADDGTLTLTFRKSQSKYVFDQLNTAGSAFLTKIQDRSDNDITFTYSGTTSAGRPKWSTATDASDRDYAVTYTGDRITKIATENYSDTVGLREWKYAYTSNRLTGFTDPGGHTTTYAYASSSSPLSTITSPSTPAGGTSTEIVYDDDQTSEVRYRYGSGADDRYTYTWDYRTTRPPACDGKGADAWTVVTDPNDNATSYCFTDRNDTGGKTKLWVYDGKGNARSTDYTADNGPSNITSPTGQATGSGGSTVVSYSGKFSESINKITEPKSSGSSSNTAASSGLTYTGSSGGVQGGDYLPKTVRSSSYDCNSYGYDSKGRTTTAYTGVTGTSTGGCGSDSTADAEYHVDYNDNGTISKTWDGNSGSSPTDADKTIYTYWSASDTGYVAKTSGQVKTIRKPGGNCATGSTRKLCTSYTYDNAGRVTSITDGRGTRTNYTYDKNDRSTGVYYNGGDATSCGLALGASCLTYNYDAEGNLTSRAQGLVSSTFAYDRLNRMTTQRTPAGGLLGGDDVVNLAYDGTGNLTSYSQTLTGVSGTFGATYTYDAANRLNKVTEGGRDIAITTDKEGRTQSITYPNTSGGTANKVEYDYSDNGRPKEMRVKNGAGTVTSKITYDYTQTLTFGAISLTIDSPQLQKRQVHNSPYSGPVGTTSYTYDNQRLVNADGPGSADYDYTYDKVGNITAETAGSTTTRYGYNRAGELCWKGPNSGTVLSQACPATPSGNTTVNRDAAGNSLGTTADPYTVNERNQVTTIDGTAKTYHDQGNDLRATNGSTREVAGPLGIDAQVNGSTATTLTRDPSGMILSSRTSAGVQNHVTEPNGNTYLLTSSSGTATAAYSYAPYGKTTSYGTASAATNRFRWLGQPQDTTTSAGDGHYKLGARYYNTTGHFTQPDPIAGGIGDPRTMTAYNYAGGDPINQADPSGYSFLEDVDKYLNVYDAGRLALSYAQQDYKKLGAQAAGVAVGAFATGACVTAGGGVGGPITATTLAVTGVCSSLGAGAGNLAEAGARKVLGG